MTNKDVLNKDGWTPEDEEIIEFFIGLIPIMQDVRRDLESKNLLEEEDPPPEDRRGVNRDI